jgi:hypothetical protein
LAQTTWPEGAGLPPECKAARVGKINAAVDQNVFRKWDGRMLSCSRYFAMVRRATLMP